MTRTLKIGDHVAWDSSQGALQGLVKKKLTCESIGGHVAKPSKKEPQYVVRSDKTGAVEAHEPNKLRKSQTRVR